MRFRVRLPRRHHSCCSWRFACFELSLCLLPLCCAARTPRTPHAALALLLLVPRTHRATTAHAAPACGRLERPCTRAPVPPARGACTRAGQPRTQVRPRGGKQPTNDTSTPPGRGGKGAACARKDTTPETPVDGARRHWAAAPATGSPPCSSHASAAHIATRPSAVNAPPLALLFLTTSPPPMATGWFAGSLVPYICFPAKRAHVRNFQAEATKPANSHRFVHAARHAACGTPKQGTRV